MNACELTGAVEPAELVGKVAREPSVRALALATAAEAFGHERVDVQEAALDLIGKLGVPDGQEGVVIAAHAQHLAPVLISKAAGLGLLSPQPPGQGVVAAQIVLAPADRDDALPPPLEDPSELVQLLSELMEDATDALAVEHALGGAVRLATLPASDRERFGLRSSSGPRRSSPGARTPVVMPASLASRWLGPQLPLSGHLRPWRSISL